MTLNAARLTELAQYNRLGRAGGFFALIVPPTVEELDEVFELAQEALVVAREPAGAGLREAARTLVEAAEAVRDAINGVGHPGTPHDRYIHMDPCTSDPGIHVYSTSSDCAACGGAEYGTEDTYSQALGDLRAALGMERRPWEEPGLRAALSEPKP